MKFSNYLTVAIRLCFLIAASFFLYECSEPTLTRMPVDDVPPSDVDDNDLDNTVLSCADCDYVVPPKQHVIDGKALNIQPGDVIGLSANVEYGNLVFRNIVGTPDRPVIIKNCDGTAIVDGTGLAFALKTQYSRHFRITGGNKDNDYGLVVKGGRIGIALGDLSTDLEVDHCEVKDIGFAGIMAKTDPDCDDATIRGNFLMKNVNLHHNYVHDTGGEGFYVGNSFWDGMQRDCGLRLPHEIHNLRINDNIIRNTGWDGIQVGCATKGTRIYANIIENYGLAEVRHQNSGMQIGGGTGGLCYGNLIRNGTGNGMIVMGLADNIVYNNIIVDAGDIGIFCDERYSPGPGFQFINNTIINPATDGIRIYAEKVPMNIIRNNVIVNPGNYNVYKYPRSGDDAFVYKLSKDVRIEMSNNLLAHDLESVGLADIKHGNFRPVAGSPLVDRGADISEYDIKYDFYKMPRSKGFGVDIGAAEF